jgi:hypothetical protein
MRYVIPFLLGVALSAGVGVYLWRSRPAPLDSAAPSSRSESSGLAALRGANAELETLLEAAGPEHFSRYLSPARVAQLMSQVAEAVQVLSESPVSNRLARAFSMLTCADNALHNLGSKCECPGESRMCERAVAWCNWIFATRIHICPSYWPPPDDPLYRAAVLVHEATHKCGSLDGAYFSYDDPYGVHGVFMIGRESIADTYGHWVYSGFRVPELKY